LTKAIAKSVGKSEKQIRDALQKTGDLGDVTMTAKLTQKTMDSFFIKKKAPKKLTVKHVFDTFVKISLCKGQNSGS
jgi:ATP-dependent DNA ligase